ncbi:MAG: type II toxin-antitoxin system RelE/ParE family toxin [Kiritimatiellae bacterium]|jgi:plasmid stabilization system protein ParE|nr:type II toxin-antitoxin system RelE/ParE family toxin [Kiritimatiellia bacterium]
MKTVRFLAPAEQEMLDAAMYYELQAPGLVSDFLDKIETALQDIRENPERFMVIKSNTRRRLIHRFPYALLYRIEPNEIVIQATMHLSRRPNYWINR